MYPISFKILILCCPKLGASIRILPFDLLNLGKTSCIGISPSVFVLKLTKISLSFIYGWSINSEISKTGLRLKSCETRLTDCPFKVNYLKNKNSMSSSDYAKTLIPTLRSWSETVFKTALTGRDQQEINNIVDQFYNAYQQEVTDNPNGHAMDYVHIIMDIEKI